MDPDPNSTAMLPPAQVPVPPRPDDRDRWPLATWEMQELLLLAMVPFGVVLLANYLVAGFLGWRSDGAEALLTAIQELALLVPIAIWIRRSGGSLAGLGLARGQWNGSDVFAGIGAGLGALVAGGITIQVTVQLVRAITGHDISVTTPIQEFNGPVLAVNAVMAAVLAPVCEEVYFRGFLFQGLRGHMRFLWAAPISAVAFAFVHVEPLRFFGLAVMGLILAAVFERRHTLASSIAAHATINAIALIALFATR